MKKFVSEIENNDLFDYYLIYGAESYLVSKCYDKLLTHLISLCNDFNTMFVDESSLKLNDILAFDETSPFMGDFRLIVFNKCDIVKSGKSSNATLAKDLTDKFKSKSTYAKYVFVEDEIDKKSSLYKFISTNGRVIELTTPSDNALVNWLSKKLESNSISASNSVLHHMIQVVGNNMNDLDNESDKLISFKYNDSLPLTTSDIDNVCSRNIKNRIYDMVKAISTNNKELALGIYTDLIEIKEEPLHILSLLNIEFKRLLITKSAINNHLSNSEIMNKLSINQTWLVNNYIKIVKNLTISTIKDSMFLLVDIDEKCKTGKLDMKYCVELFIGSVCN